MEEFVEEFEVPEFTQHKCANGEPRDGEYKGDSDDQMMSAKIYPNGDEPENEHYVSIVFDEFEFLQFEDSSDPLPSSVQYTVSVVDINGESRFSQSFGMDFDSTMEQDSMDINEPIKLKRFIERSVLLDSREELLPEDTLRLRCEVVCSYKYLQETNDEETERKRVHVPTEEESWFLQTEDPDEDDPLFDLSNPDSLLCTKLRKKSDFFEALFRGPCKEMEDGYLRIDWSEYVAFHDMLSYIRYDDLRHISWNRQYCRLYEVSAKYRVVELQEKCSSYLKQNLTSYCAIDALRIADCNNDSELRAIAYKCILSNWALSKIFETFPKLATELRNQLICAAQILNVEREAKDTLCYLATREVVLNWDKVQNSPMWSIFATKLPDLTQVILSHGSGGYTLNEPDIDSKLLEKNM